MGEISLVYLLRHAGYRVVDFFRHWYIHGFLRAGDWTIVLLERLDKFFALRITLRNLLKPLYQDYSLIGYGLGFLFRSGRLLAGGIVYLAIILAAIALYAAWSLVPAFLIYKIIFSIA